MKATVDQDVCIGCRICEGTCPEVFKVKPGTFKAEAVAETDDPALQDAADGCPVSAISIEY